MAQGAEAAELAVPHAMLEDSKGVWSAKMKTRPEGVGIGVPGSQRRGTGERTNQGGGQGCASRECNIPIQS